METTFTPGGSMPLLSSSTFFVDRVQRWPRIRALTHQHDALNDVGFIDDVSVLHMVRPGHVSQANLGALRYLGYVLHPKSGSFLCLQDRLLDIAHVTEKPERTNIHLLQAGLHEAAAGVDVDRKSTRLNSSHANISSA